MRVWPALSFLCLWPALAAAGPWPREPGGWFVSLSVFANDRAAAIPTPAANPTGYASLYLEYGFSPRLTFGLDVGKGLRQGSDGGHTAIAFLRWPLPLGTPGAPVAAQIGLGQTRANGRTEPVVQAMLSAGRGIETGLAPGWLALDAQLQHRVERGETIVKADATWGLRPTPRDKLILQVQAGDYPGSDAYLRFAPSWVREIAPGRHIEIGVDADLAGSGRVGVKLGTWWEF